MPLVHRLSGPKFATNEDSPRLRPSAATLPGQPRPAQSAPEPSGRINCRLCTTRAAVFDLSMPCCVDRYESLFGSVHEHRSMFAHALRAALRGDYLPARRLVESYRRVFGAMAAVELKRILWQSIAEAQVRPSSPYGLRRAGPSSQPACVASGQADHAA
jgi:hypothetical protein